MLQAVFFYWKIRDYIHLPESQVKMIEYVNLDKKTMMKYIDYVVAANRAYRLIGRRARR